MFNKTKHGFTLVELIIAIFLTSIVAAGVATLLSGGLQAYSSGKNLINADWKLRVAVERMSRDIRAVAAANYINDAQETIFNFTNSFGNTIVYQCINGQILRNSQVLVDNVSHCVFRYYTSNDIQTLTTTLISYIGIDLGVNYNGVISNVTTMVFPWGQG